MPPTGHLEKCFRYSLYLYPPHSCTAIEQLFLTLRLEITKSRCFKIRYDNNFIWTRFLDRSVPNGVGLHDPPRHITASVAVDTRSDTLIVSKCALILNEIELRAMLLTMRVTAPCARIWNLPSQNRAKVTRFFRPTREMSSFGGFAKTKRFFEWFNRPWLRRVFRAARFTSLLFGIGTSCYLYGQMELLDDPFGHQQVTRHKILSSLGAEFCFGFIENENIRYEVGKVLSETPINLAMS